MQPTYENALALLESRRRKARPTKLAHTPDHDIPATPSGAPTVKGTPSIVGMKEWLLKLGHSENDVGSLNVIHVTGTKGKGSTCAFTRSFLHAHGLRTGFPKRIGLYTSPDLQCIRERIQIDNEPITESVFTQHFFEVWEALASSPEGKSGEITRQPRYLQLLLLLAFHTFIKEGVDAAIVETHHGREYCATNVVRQPVVTGITSLGLDHVAQLGPTVEDIAWHKSGIFKPGAPAFSVDQEPGPVEVLRGRAAERKTVLTFVSPSNTLPANSRVLGVPVQRLNCSLAIQLASKFVEIKDSSHPLSERDIIEGVQNFSWLGRFEIIETKSARWLLDGAHNTLSITQAAAWFATNVKNGDGRNFRVLIFSHFSKERDGFELLASLWQALHEQKALPDHVIFTTYHEREDGGTRIDKTLKMPETPFPDLCGLYASRWRELQPDATVSTESTIEGAIRSANHLSSQQGSIEVFITGSLHLVGGALSILRP